MIDKPKDIKTSLDLPGCTFCGLARQGDCIPAHTCGDGRAVGNVSLPNSKELALIKVEKARRKLADLGLILNSFTETEFKILPAYFKRGVGNISAQALQDMRWFDHATNLTVKPRAEAHKKRQAEALESK